MDLCTRMVKTVLQRSRGLSRGDFIQHPPVVDHRAATNDECAAAQRPSAAPDMTHQAVTRTNRNGRTSATLETTGLVVFLHDRPPIFHTERSRRIHRVPTHRHHAGCPRPSRVAHARAARATSARLGSAHSWDLLPPVRDALAACALRFLLTTRCPWSGGIYKMGCGGEGRGQAGLVPSFPSCVSVPRPLAVLWSRPEVSVASTG